MKRRLTEDDRRRAEAEDVYNAIRSAQREVAIGIISEALTVARISGLNAAIIAGRPAPAARSRPSAARPTHRTTTKAK